MHGKFELFGFRFGLGLIIDLFPGIGDIAVVAISLYIFNMARQYRLPRLVKFRMLLNVGIYFIVGLIPLLGDFLAAWWKPNRRNLELVRKNIR